MLILETIMEAASATPTKRDRKINFSDTELHILFDKYAASAALLTGKFCATITHKRKAAIWTEIAEAVSACGFVLRSSLDVQKEWSDIRRGCITVAADIKRPKTEGGPADCLFNSVSVLLSGTRVMATELRVRCSVELVLN